MTSLKGLAPAKINLTLHVTGQREAGYHFLDSLVVFADIGDEIIVTPQDGVTLSVRGPFAEGVPTDQSNIVLKALESLKALHGIDVGAHIALHKHLPNAAGIGGGSSDAATTLSMLAKLWDVPELSPSSKEALNLGADVPACMSAPSPVRMSGIGEELSPVVELPDCAMVLANPRVSVPTGQIFTALPSKTNAPMETIPNGISFDSFVDWVTSQRNDLLGPARRIAPEIDVVLGRLAASPLVAATGMSGSGATCFGLVKNMADARKVARAIQVSEMNWWVAPAQILK